ncbi:MAG: hypothetical protein ACYDER_23835 [Ktedonobacteraceae bacterium]
MAISQNYEQELADILSLLNPPQQDYETLADKAWQFLNVLQAELPESAEPSLVQALAKYFALFATGYGQWQQTYDYPKIHEYFYGAYLQAKKIGGSLSASTKTIAMLEEMTKAMMAYTNCENALINSDPEQLRQSATQATIHVESALNLLRQMLIAKSIKDEIHTYLLMNKHLWQGLVICAQGYLDAQQGEELPASAQRAMEQLLRGLEDESQELRGLEDESQELRGLEDESQELFSELNAHYSFVQRQSQFRRKTTSSLHIKQGTLFLRAIGYISEKEVSALFEGFNTVAKNEHLRERIKRKTGLPIETIRASVLMDIFETVLGKEYLEQLVLDFSSDDPVLSFKLHMGGEEKEYQLDVFQISIARFGAISVEFGIPLEDVSVSHVRALESLISPHAGRLNFVWKGDLKEPGEDGNLNGSKDLIKPPRKRELKESKEDSNDSNHIDFVEYFLYCQKLFCYLHATLPEAEAKKLDGMRGILANWESNLCELADCLPRRSANAGSQTQELEKDRNAIYLSLQENYIQINQPLRSYLNNSTAVQDSELEQFHMLGRELFAEGRHFGRLIDIADLIINRMHKFLEREYGSAVHNQTLQSIQMQDVRYFSDFDPNMGWQSILYCNQLVLIEADGKELKPDSEAEYQSVLSHPEFKGFAIQSREARAGIDDWMFVDTPKIQNLATIRSHENDILYVGVNKAFLWFPDDPEFIINQYIETTRLIADIRTLVLTFNNHAKKQISVLEKFLEKFEEAKDGSNIGLTKILLWVKNIRYIHLKRTQEEQIVRNASLKKTRHELLELRNGIEIFYIHAERVLDLLRACTISKYQDHSELLKKMLRESEADDSQISLERNIKNLGRFHGYLSDLLQQKIEERNRSNQILIAVTLFVLTSLSALSAISALFQFLDPHRVFFGLTVALLVLTVSSCVIIGLFVWQRNRNT